jgi:hypothetical protein
MHRLLFQCGAILVSFSLIVWLIYFLINNVNVPVKELSAVAAFGAFLMLPEMLYQLCQFLSSKAPLDD